MITADMITAGAEALRGQIATMGCTCRWDEDGNPPDTCRCSAREAQRRWLLAKRVLHAAHEVVSEDEPFQAALRGDELPKFYCESSFHQERHSEPEPDVCPVCLSSWWATDGSEPWDPAMEWLKVLARR